MSGCSRTASSAVRKRSPRMSAGSPLSGQLGTASADRREHPALLTLEQGAEQFLSIGEGVVDDGLRDFRLAGDPLHREAAETLFGDQPQGGVEQLLATFLAWEPGRVPRGLRRHWLELDNSAISVNVRYRMYGAVQTRVADRALGGRRATRPARRDRRRSTGVGPRPSFWLASPTGAATQVLARAAASPHGPSAPPDGLRCRCSSPPSRCS